MSDGPTGDGRSPKDAAKPFCIARQEVLDAYQKVKSNKGAAGVDEQSIAEFERDFKRNLYRIWNRLSSGSYFPPRVAAHRPLPKAITVDHGIEFTSRALDEWAYRRRVELAFTRPGKPTENALIESFNGRLRDECLNVHSFVSIAQAQRLIEEWRRDYNDRRPRRTRSRDPE